MHRVRHRLLGCKFSATPKQLVAVYFRDFCGVDNVPADCNQHYCREDDIRMTLMLMVLQHLGYPLPKPYKQFLNPGVDVAVEFFTGDWWKHDPDDRDCMDKSRKRRKLDWFKAFSRGLLLGLLSERWKDVARVCGWLEAHIKQDTMGIDEDLELPDIYKSVAASLRPAPMPGLDKLEKQLRTCRFDRPRLLFLAWDAARRKDQPGFDQAFLQCLHHFAKYHGSGLAPEHWIATHESVVALAARRLGMKLPALPPELDAVVIRPETLRDRGKVKHAS